MVASNHWLLSTRIHALFNVVPGSDERKLKSSLSLAADCLVYDLEDGVAHNRKNIAREMVFDALEASEHRKAEKAVRINAVGSGLEFDDLNVVVSAVSTMIESLKLKSSGQR